MLVCASCGAENREGARFCDSCGTALGEAGPAREVRKVVTVLFCDVTGSTALGERIDPESLRQVMSRYFETAKAIVERHGGTVEKFIGDAVMAVFGVPAVHEDDALRAMRAAAELRGGLVDLNDELERGYGTRLELRMGVNTGEVVAGTEERLATGDAVNVAARLEQAAQPGEVLLGEETYRLVRDAVVADESPPVSAKGKSQALRAYRLVSVQAGAPERRHGAPMIGRGRQRELLEGAFANVVSERACHLFTILGAAGVGKSRLAQEFLAGLDATVVTGRCLSYGEGISYWPVTEVVKQLVPGGAVEGPLASILGDEEAAGSPEEIAWAFRKLLESRAAERPLVAVFDDLHWGEPTFFDLVEHVADLSRDAPIMLLCMARPELLDARRGWGGGKLNATNVLLEPLAPEETTELIAALSDGVADDLREGILEAAGGNPLFVEEMLAMAQEGGEVAVPPTIQALLAARLDQLDPAERGVLERGAVEGQVFHRGAVLALAPDEPQLDGRLVTLVRKDLVRPEPPVLPDDDAYRFRHLLIRDTAYEALPKATRAVLHERFATWLEKHGAALVEVDEIVGYHLEQAHRYRSELGPLDGAAASVAERAAERLLKSAERARTRGDVSAAIGLEERALDLMPESHPARPATQLDLAMLLGERGDLDRGVELRDEVEVAARELGDERLLARATLAAVEQEVQSDPGATIARALERAGGAFEVLERLGDEEGSIWALRLMGNLTSWDGDGTTAAAYYTEALRRAEHARAWLSDEVRVWLLWSCWWGPTSPEEVHRVCDEIEASTGSVRLKALVLMVRGGTIGSAGRVDEGRALLAEGRRLLRDLGATVWWAGTSMMEAELELYAGDYQRGLDSVAEGRAALEESAETGYLATAVGFQGHLCAMLGRDDEALVYADEADAMGQADDFEPHARAHVIRAFVLARRGEQDAAREQLARAAELIEPRDFTILHLDLAFARAEVARLAGRTDEARRALEHGASVAEAKGHLLALERARRTLEALD
ncbi:MAG TPA: adenylate/guanylate cyclase domain-containing protein [Gaiellaceae bacterium]|nr:adenylate/guanylate cyclase domain-containing protein [Gaiellaceae bacterium]